MNLSDINPESFYGGMRDPYDSEEFEQSLNERTEDAQEQHVFNCPLCGDHYNTKRIYICEHHQEEL